MNNTQYRFRDFDHLPDKPSDVYRGNDFLGTIVYKPDGYTIKMIKGPYVSRMIKDGPKNVFPTKLEAAEMLHRVWEQLQKSKE